jgi:hypothetical protein
VVLGGMMLACEGPPFPAAAPSASLPPGDYTPRDPPDELDLPPERLAAVRRDALRRAKVWEPPARPIPSVDLAANPAGPGTWRREAELTCRFLLKGSDGRSPKFACVLPGGEVLKVKYGRNNPEIYAEVAATRLLAALGFGADDLSVVARVRCFGCPPFPYPKGLVFDALQMDYGRAVDFTDVTIERRRAGLAVDDAGWHWSELEATDPASGGASRRERDALRLMAVFLGHWDGKPENQRLLCRDGEGQAPCPRPLAYIHDPGQTFGPKSVDLAGWSSRPVFADAARCTLSMRGMPFDGAGFGEPRIGEEGRALVASLLRQVTAAQVRSLFEGARFTAFFRNTDEAKDVDNWVRAFQHRVAQIADRPPCPER